LWIVWSGCAKYPPEPESLSRRLLTMDLWFAGEVNPDYYYYWAIDTNGDPGDGPLPIASGPFFGNGWGTGAFTYYVEFHNNLYRFFRGRPDNQPGQDQDLGWQFQAVGLPTAENPNRLWVRIPLQTLREKETDPLPKYLDLNFITVNLIVLPGDLPPADRDFDGLGLSGNAYIRELDTRTDTTIANNPLGASYETEGDVSPEFRALDLVNWRVEIQGE